MKAYCRKKKKKKRNTAIPHNKNHSLLPIDMASINLSYAVPHNKDHNHSYQLNILLNRCLSKTNR